MEDVKEITIDFNSDEIILGNYDYPNTGSKPPIRVKIPVGMVITQNVLLEIFNYLGDSEHFRFSRVDEDTRTTIYES